jgi:hypothetical protein
MTPPRHVSAPHYSRRLPSPAKKLKTFKKGGEHDVINEGIFYEKKILSNELETEMMMSLAE